ncbi:MAG: anti-sigma factor family protein [Candidatus Rifleibacteriota bacterium]
MKSCPEKIDLYRFIDKDLSSENAEEIYQHIRQCRSCRIEVEEIINKEKAVCRNFDEAFSGSRLKEKVLTKIAELKLEPDQNEEKKLSARKIWFWIFAPGLAIIFFAALLNTVQLMKTRDNITQLITCKAIGQNAFYNNQPVVPGKEINLLDLAQPATIEGNFIFKVTSETTSTFSHIGKSVLKPVKNLKLEFINSDAVFKLLEGQPVKIIINKSEHWLNKQNYKATSRQSDKKISEKKMNDRVSNNKCASETRALASCSKIIINNEKNHSNQIKEPLVTTSETSTTNVPPDVASDMATDVETEVATRTLKDENSKVLASDSVLLNPEKQPLNPFEDKPLQIERK